MEKTENEAVAMFDTLYTTNHLQLLKILLPYLEEELQKKLAIYIKFQEMQYTIKYLKEHVLFRTERILQKKEFNMQTLISEMSPYFTDQERNMANQFSNLKNMMDSMEQFAPIINMMQSAGGFGGSGDSMDFLKGMLSPDQLGMFEMFQQLDF